MATLQITCFGKFHIERDGLAPNVVLTDKARCLLVYLALEPQVHQRSALTEIFWPGYSEESARNSLRQTLHLLRQFLAEDETLPWLLVTRQMVQFNPAASCNIDVATFRTRLAAVTSHAHAELVTCPTCLASLRQAVDLYRGDFLAGLSVIDSDAFEEWRRLTQEQLHLQMLDGLNWLTTATERAGDTAGALQAAQRQLTLEPWLETAHRRIMRLLAQQGQRAAAEAQYQRCRQVLAEELGAEPDAETMALYAQIRKGGFDKETRGQGERETGDKETRGQETRRQGDRRQGDRRQEGIAETAGEPLTSPVSPSPVSLSPVSPSPVSLSPVSLSPLRDWAEMPAVDFFVERSGEVAQLTAWLLPSRAPNSPAPVDAGAPPSGGAPAQLISLLGMGGIGKTTLAARVTKAVAPNFRVVIWRSLLNAPPFSQLLRDWLQVLSRQTLTTFPDSLDEQLRLLLSYLQQERCLLVLDNVESLFAPASPGEAAPSGGGEGASRAGVMRPGYEGYDQLFQRLANSDHQSCLLLTSREQPYALVRLGRQAQSTTGRIRLLPLTGLDQAAGSALLESNGLHAAPTEAAKLVENYSGNPLALQIVAATIVDFFDGDVTLFQQEEGALFDGMRLVLDQQFARLSPLERDILVWLALEREAITVPLLRSNFAQPVATAPLLEALQALQNRSLLEKRDSGFTLQNVIIEYTTEYLVEQVYQEIYDFGFTNYDLHASLSDTERVNQKSKIVNLFLNRFALLKAQAREEVRQSQVRLILQPLANRLLAQLGKAKLEEQMMTLVQQCQAAGVTPGYAGGNLLNLLVHIGGELRGRDFSRLALWQVFLAGAYAPGLNLTGADLRGAVFTQRFSPQRSFQFDAQGDLLLVEIRDGRLRLIRLRDGLLYQELGLPPLRILLIELSPDCRTVLLQLADNQLALLELTTGQFSSPLVRHRHSIWRVSFSPDGRLVATGDSGGLVCIWDRQSGQLVQDWQITTSGVSALALAPDGVTVASANVAGTVFLCSFADPTLIRRLTGHHEEVATLTFLDEGKLLASGSHDMTVGLWDVATGELRQRLRGHTRPIRLSVATNTGQWLVTGGGDHFLYVWDWQRGAPQHLLTDHAAAIDSLMISPDGQRAATIDLNAVVSLWDLAQGRRIDFYPIYHNSIMSLQFTPDGAGLVSGGSDGAVYLWQRVEGGGAHLIARLTARKERIFSVVVHPDGNLIASGGDGSAIALWARNSGRLLQTLQAPTRNIAMLAISPDGQWLASSNGDGTVSLWSLPEGGQRRQLQVHTNMVTCCAFSPTGVAAHGRTQQRLASGSFDHTLAIWDAESGALLQHLHGHTNAVGRCLFSQDGQRLLSISYDETLRSWDVASGQPLTVWPQRGGGYIALALHPAGEILAVSCADHTVCLLDLNSGRCLAELAGHSQIVIALAFHPNGQWLASAGTDETIKLWDLSADAIPTGQIVCRHTLHVPAPYAGMKIGGVTGISEAQRAALRALGAVEE
ncbi:MAG: BTAD domain-containing putative transcriptional regulator [Caldilineaceae bacterium]